MTNFKPKHKRKSQKNKLKADFTKEIGDTRKCNFCKSYMAYSKVCALGNKPSSKFTCYKFEVKAGKEKEYRQFLISLKNNNHKSPRKSVK